MNAKIQIYIDETHVFTGYIYDIDANLAPATLSITTHDATYILMRKKVNQNKSYTNDKTIQQVITDIIQTFVPEVSTSGVSDSRGTGVGINIANNSQSVFYVIRELGRRFNGLWYVDKDFTMIWREKAVGSTPVEVLAEGELLQNLTVRKTLNDDGSVTTTAIQAEYPYSGMRLYGDTVRVVSKSYDIDSLYLVEEANVDISANTRTTRLDITALVEPQKLEDQLYRPESSSGVSYA
jgi:prophage tail gpP-like protein